MTAVTHPPCFHWQDTNEDPPAVAGEYIGMWINDDGVTDTMPVHYDPDSFTEWTYDDQATRPPHVWCANPDALNHWRHGPPPPEGDTPPVKPNRKTTTAIIAIWTLITAVMGLTVGFGLGAAVANDNQWVANTLVVGLIVGLAIGDVILMRGRRRGV